MTVREVLQIGHPVLAAVAEPIGVSDIQSAGVQGWIDDLIDTMRDANGAGIAANQVGIPYRLFTVEVGNNPRYPYKPAIPLTVVINPEVKFLSDQTFEANEGCLSVPQMRGVVERHLEIEVSGYNREGEHQRFEVRGYSAATWQHEADHLDGILFPHRVKNSSTFTSWKIFQEYHQADFAKKVEALVAEWGQ